MKSCKTALAKSGTVTLELALHQVPTVVHYDVSTFNYLIAKYILKIQLSHYCIVNILHKGTLNPEWIGHRIQTAPLIEELEDIHFNLNRRQQIREGCKKLMQKLGNPLSHQQAIAAIRLLR